MTIHRRTLLGGTVTARSGNPDPFHISSFVVRCRPQNLARLMSEVGNMPGVELHGSDPLGKFVALLDLPSEQALVDTMTAIERLEGVINASMVYHHVE